MIWAAKLAVVGRVTRVAYGTASWTPYDPSNPEHQSRKVYKRPEGYSVAGYWSEIVGKVSESVDVITTFTPQAKLLHPREFF